MTEYKISQQLSCENKHIICYKDICKYNNKMSFIMNYIPNFTLLDYIEKRKDNDFKTNLLYLKQILKTVNYIHNKGVVHRDLKPQNILIYNGNVYIIDLSLNINPEQVSILKGTPRYLSPELWINKFDKDIDKKEMFEILKKSDIYSCGIIAYYLFFGDLPIDTSNIKILKSKTINGEIEIPKPITKNETIIYNIISSLLIVDYRKRPDINTILKMFE